MVRPSKLYQHLVATRTEMRFRDFQRILEAFSFTLDPIKGGHHSTSPLVPRPLSVQPHGGMAKPYQIDQFLDNVEEFGLKIGE